MKARCFSKCAWQTNPAQDPLLADVKTQAQLLTRRASDQEANKSVP